MSKDLIFKGGNNICHFKYLEWDSEFFNKRSYFLDLEKSINISPSEELKLFIEKRFKDSFLSLKVSSTQVELISFFQDCGFKYIDDEIVLKNTIDKYECQDKNDLVFIGERNSLDFDLKELSKVFEFSRFHNDTCIAKEQADLLWEQYFKNFKISDLKRVFLVKKDSENAGIIFVNIVDKKATLFIVSVKDNFRSLGIGSFLIQNTLNFLDSYEVYTETQVKNVKALNFYIKNGFTKIEKTLTVMHRWS